MGATPCDINEYVRVWDHVDYDDSSEPCRSVWILHSNKKHKMIYGGGEVILYYFYSSFFYYFILSHIIIIIKKS